MPAPAPSVSEHVASVPCRSLHQPLYPLSPYLTVMISHGPLPCVPACQEGPFQVPARQSGPAACVPCCSLFQRLCHLSLCLPVKRGAPARGLETFLQRRGAFSVSRQTTGHGHTPLCPPRVPHSTGRRSWRSSSSKASRRAPLMVGISANLADQATDVRTYYA